ncbi:S8 family peptidase [Kribbella sp. NPDC003557]|uniref:S8 family peptidase n=1 Tax=Kribbella sp. NPDC003557 TaxID=3154449 RepID=UPI0033A38ED1
MRVFCKPAVPITAVLLAATVGFVTQSTSSPSSAAQPAPAPAVGNSASVAERTVTLITGDQIRVSSDLRRLQFVAGPGRTNVRYSVHRGPDGVTIIPSDAIALVAGGRLDRRLFNVNELLTHTAAASEIPVIVAYSGQATSPGALRAFDSTPRLLPAVNGAALGLTKSKAASLYAELTGSRRTATPISKIWLDGRRKPLLDQSTRQIGAPTAWAAGLTGKGVKVAVLDSGVDVAHPDFAGRLTSADFTDTQTDDDVGHGTHVASIVAGSGQASDGKYRGVAPEASILSGRVCTPDGCPDSAILAGLDWSAAQGAKVVNLSLGGTDSPEIDPVEQAVNKLSAERGMLFVVAAGNDGPDAGSLDSPASAEAAMAVGAVERSDQMADFSSRGPSADDGTIKPDVTAPGVGIVAAKAAASTIGEPVGTSYLRLSGTSMATPHVSGAAALLLQAHPGWTGQQLKAVLMGSAHEVPGVPMTAQGAGRIDIAAALKSPVVPSTGSIGFAEQRWPHSDDKPEEQTVSYTNEGDQPIELTLAASLTGPDGKPAPAAALRLSTESLTVPAHSTAKAVVTSNTATPGPDGQYTGRLIARSGSGAALTTTLAVRREVESYDLTVRHLDRSGAPTTDQVDSLVDRDATEAQDRSRMYLQGTGSQYTIRVPKGHYLLDSVIGLNGAANESTSLVMPKLDLTSDRTVTLDARRAKPVQITVPDRRAANVSTMAAYELKTPLFNFGGGVGGFQAPKLFTGQLGPSVAGLTTSVRSEFSQGTQNPDGEYVDSPVVYQLNWSKLDGFLNGFVKAVSDTELTTLRPTMLATSGQGTALLSAMRMSPNINIDFGGSYRYTKLPATPIIRMTVADDFRWQPRVSYVAGDQRIGFTQSEVACQPGKTCSSQWGNTVVTPVQADARLLAFGSLDLANATEFSRTGNTLTLKAAGADGSGHVARIGGKFTLTPKGGSPTTVENDGEGSVEVGAGDASYQLELATDGSPLGVSTRTKTSWRFTSGATAATKALPLWTVSYHPESNGSRSVRTGAVRHLPFEFASLPGAPVGALTAVDLQTSTDAGKTWQHAKLHHTGTSRYVAEITTPADAKTVSVRTTATDTRGNTVAQQIDDAYNLSQ